MKRLITILLPILGMIESANANGKVLNTPPIAIVQQVIEVDINDKNCIDSTEVDELQSKSQLSPTQHNEINQIHRDLRDMVLACSPITDSVFKNLPGEIVGGIPVFEGDFSFSVMIKDGLSSRRTVFRVFLSTVNSKSGKTYTRNDLLARLKDGFKIKLIYQGPRIDNGSFDK